MAKYGPYAVEPCTGRFLPPAATRSDEGMIPIPYPFAQFLYASKSAPRLAAPVRDGLEQMIVDGRMS